ncbi:MAG TPA: signal peptidase II [Polyangiaceae bacterium]
MSEIAAVQPSAAEPNRIAEGVPRLGTPPGAANVIPGRAPSFFFLAVVSIVSLASDIATKFWAEKNLDGYPGIKEVWKDHLAFILARNRGGAWGLLQSTNENVRRPFFLLVSAAAIAFIVTLYRKLTQDQKALAWGLPLVLGGALGNVFDRIRYGHVIDFIDFHVTLQGGYWEQKGWAGEHHWPTFNVADIAICVGVALMAIDMFTSKRGKLSATQPGPEKPPTDPQQPVNPDNPNPVPLPEEPAPPSAALEVPPVDASPPSAVAADASTTSTTSEATETKPAEETTEAKS